MQSLAGIAASRLLLILGCCMVAACADTDMATVNAIPEEVRQSVRAAVDQNHRTGVAVGLVNPQGQFSYAYGKAGGDTAIDADTQFALGSVTKVFTAEALAALVKAELVSLEQPLNQIWPETDSQITLAQLATHRAGLPREIPPAALAANSVEPLLDLLPLTEDSTADRSYSNAGMALLGQALEVSSGESLPSIVQHHLLTPWNLTHTGYQPDPARLATPHRGGQDISIQRAQTPDVAYGAGGLHSTANDLLIFLASHLEAPYDQSTGWLGLVFPVDAPPLGWKVHQGDNWQAYYHGGEGNGFQSFIGFRPDNGVGVVLLTNSSADDDLQQIAQHLLDPGVALPSFEQPPALALSEAELAPYVGRYLMSEDPEGNLFELLVDNSRLIFVERTPEGDLVRRSPLRATGEGQFSLSEIPVTIEFGPTDLEGQPASAQLRFEDQSWTLARQSNSTE